MDDLNEPDLLDAESTAQEKLEEFLCSLAESAAARFPEIDPSEFLALNPRVSNIARHIPESLQGEERFALIKAVFQEFEDYHEQSKGNIPERQGSWRGLTVALVQAQFDALGLDPETEEASRLMSRIGSLLSVEEVESYRVQLIDFLRIHAKNTAKAAPLKSANLTNANDNPAGLRGSDAALKQVSKMIEKGSPDFVVIFHLEHLEMIEKKYGQEAMQDSIMAMAAYISSSLRSDDSLYYWDNTCMLAVLENRIVEKILRISLQRVVNNLRDFTVRVGNRDIMIRVPLSFELTPVRELQGVNDLLQLIEPAVREW